MCKEVLRVFFSTPWLYRSLCLEVLTSLCEPEQVPLLGFFHASVNSNTNFNFNLNPRLFRLGHLRSQ